MTQKVWLDFALGKAARRLPRQVLVCRLRMSTFWLQPRLIAIGTIFAAFGSLVAANDLSLAWIAGCSLIGLGVAIFSKDIRLGIMALAIPILFWAYTNYRAPKPDQGEIGQVVSHGNVCFRGHVDQVLSSAGQSPKRFIVKCDRLLFPKPQELTGRTLVICYGDSPDIAINNEVEVKARLEPPETKRFPWQMDESKYLAKQKIFSKAQAISIIKTTVSPPHSDSDNTDQSKTNPFDKLREHLTETHSRLIGKTEGELLSSVVLGDRAVKLPNDVSASFRGSGLSQVLVASGFNMTVVIAMTYWLTQLITKRIWAVNLVCMTTMFLYVGLAGTSPSILRSALMCSLVLLGRTYFRSTYTPACIGIALLSSVIAEPASVSDIGLQLSYSATLGIVFGATRITRLFTSNRTHKVIRWLIQAAAIATMAQASVMPILLLYFWKLEPFCLPANLIVAPLVEGLTWLGFASSSIILCDPANTLLPLAHIFDWLAVWPLRFMLLVAKTFSSLEQSTISFGPPSEFWLCSYYACFSIFLITLRLEKFRMVALSTLLLSLVGLLWRPTLDTITIAHFRNAVVALNTDRSAYAFGEYDNPKVERFASYFGAKLRDGNTALKTNPDLLKHLQAAPHVDVFIDKPFHHKRATDVYNESHDSTRSGNICGGTRPDQ